MKFVKFVVEKKDKGMEKVIVIHAKHLRERMVHMERQLRDWPGEVVYVTEADKDELTDELIDIVDHQLEGALVLEDDIVLHQGFEADFEKTMAEYRAHYAEQSIIISYEDSSLQFIPRSRRRKGLWLYEAPHGRVRFNGALYINQKAAQAIVDDVKANKCDIAVDHYYMHLYGKGLLQFLWCEPALATQGSFNGSFVSSMGQIRSLEGLRWKLKYAYKRLVYWFR